MNHVTSYVALPILSRKGYNVNMEINYNSFMIRNRFNELLREKLKRENRQASLRQISFELELPYKTVHAWAHDEITRYDAVMVEKLCRYFGVAVGELLELTD